jgi:pimeloyl-ACP methyl ester carboxylesterase
LISCAQTKSYRQWDQAAAETDAAQALATVKDLALVMQGKFEAAGLCGEQDRLPVVLLPGIAGSRLVADEEEAWPLFPFKGKLPRWKLLLDSEGHPAFNARADGVIAKVTVAHFFETHVYGGLVKFLDEMGYNEGKLLFPFPYDWRLGNEEHLADLDKAIDRALAASNRRKVVLLAHSMGGLVARAYLLSSAARAEKVDTLVTLNTPFWGAPKAYYALLNGYDFSNTTVKTSTMKILGQNWPGPYQLLPRVPFIYEPAGDDLRPVSLEDCFNTVRYKGYSRFGPGTLETTAPDPPLNVDQCAYLIQGTWLGIEVLLERSQNTWRLNPKLLAAADSFHALGGPAESPKALPQGIKHFAIVGQGIRTLVGYYLRAPVPGNLWDENAIELKGRKVVMEPIFGNGDGTVPLGRQRISTAGTTYYVSNQWVRGPATELSSRHMDTPGNPNVHRIIAAILRKKPLPTADFSEGAPNVALTGILQQPQSVSTLADSGDGLDFILQSNARLHIIDTASGKTLGVDENGGIEESVPSGTFLVIGPYEYASLGAVDRDMKVEVVGTGEGQFKLTTRVRKGDKIWTHAYPEVKVKKGMVSQFTINPSLVTDSLPPLQMTSDGQSTSVRAEVKTEIIPQHASENDPRKAAEHRSAVVASVLVAAVIAMLVLFVMLRRLARRRTN